MRRHVATVLAAVIAASATSYALADANRPEATATAVSTTKIYNAVRALRSRVDAVDSRIRAIDDDVEAVRDNVAKARTQLHQTCQLLSDQAYACPSGVFP